MKIKSSRIALILGTVLLVGVAVGLIGCVPTAGVQPGGWSGGTISNDTLFIGSMSGKIVSFNTSGARLWVASLTSSEKVSGGFGCAPASSPRLVIYGSPAVSDNLVYVGSYFRIGGQERGMIHTFEPGRNEPKWVYPRQGSLNGAVIGSPIVAQDKLFFGSTNGTVYALTTADGYDEWVFNAGGKIWSTPAVDSDTLYIGSFDNKLYALNTADGSKKWEFKTEGAIVATPVINNNVVYVGSFDRYLYAIDTNDGSLKWKFKAENWFWAKPVMYDGSLYAANLDGKVYVLNASNGDKAGEFDLGSPVSSSPVIAGDKVVVATESGMVYGLYPSSNEKKLLVDLKKKINAPLVASEGIVYVHTELDNLYAIDESGVMREFSLN